MERIIHRIDPSRLAYGAYNHERDTDEGEGDIRGSYSADIIAIEGRVRKPFKFQGSMWVMTGSSGRGLTVSGEHEFHAIRIVPVRMFEGTPTTYNAKTGTADGAEAARNDPLGFYHGMSVSLGKERYVLCGPEAVFMADELPARPDGTVQPKQEQLTLF